MPQENKDTQTENSAVSGSVIFEPSDLMRGLIASSLYSYAYVDTKNSSCYSLDMVRFDIRFSPNQLDKVLDSIDTWTLPDYVNSYASNKIGGYRYLRTLKFDDLDTSIAIGIGLIEGTGATNSGRGFVEYNPNKIGVEGISLVKRLLNLDIRFEVARYDLAIDYVISRNTVRMLKDSRKYGCELSSGFTEYLGQRNKPGRVKCYDKQAESNLDLPCTRVELTCSGAWSADKVLEKLPIVFSYDNASFDSLQRNTRAFAIAVQALVANGDTLETWLGLVDARTRTKIRKAFGESRAFEYNKTCIASIRHQVEKIKNGTWEPADKPVFVDWL